MRTVALVTSGAHTIANFRGTLIAELVARGDRVLALAPDYTPALRATVAELGAEPVDFSLERTGTHPVRDLMDMVRLARRLRQLKPDLVLTNFAKPVIYGTLAAAIARVPRRIAMLEGLGYVFNEQAGHFGWKRRLLRAVTRLLYKVALSRAERVIFLNAQDVEEFVAGRVLPASKAVNIGGIGVDLDQFAQLEPATDPVTFLLMARLIREKGIVEFAEAARVMRSRFPATGFLLIGGLDDNPGGLARDEVEAWVREGILDWPGHVDDVRPFIARSSVLVLPSYYREGVPRSLQEATAMGRAIITTDNVGCRDTVEDGVNGFIVPIRRVEPLVEAMARFVERPELIGQMGRESRRLAEERFDARAANRRMLALLG